MRFITSFTFLIDCTIALQIPLLSSINNDQEPLITKQPLVSSEALQNDITAGNLLGQAEWLYILGELSLLEYGHRTRVIGSKGVH